MGDGTETTRTAVVDGVRVRKTIEDGSEETGTVTLDVAVERDEPAVVRLAEPALGSIPRDDVELHTDHGAEFWDFEGDATFEREFDAGESYAVVYRVRDVGADRLETLDSEPVVELAEASAPLEGVVSRAGSDAVRELLDGERDSLAAASASGSSGSVELSLETGGVDATEDDGVSDDSAADDPGDGSPGEQAPTSAGDGPTDVPSAAPAEGTPGDSAAASGDDAADGSTADTTEVPTGASAAGAASSAAGASGGVARVLLKELREDRVDEETAEALRSELEPGRSQDVRISHLQSQVADIAAYAEMLESFIDEHGTFDSVFGGVADDLSALDDDVETLQAAVDDLTETVETDDGDLETAVEDLEDGQSDIAARVDSLESRLETVDDRLDDLEAFESRLSGAFQSLESGDVGE